MLEFWIFLAYCAGTLIGLIIGRRTGVESGSNKLLAVLLAGGYLNYSKSKDGNIHIKKLGE
jgi:hypothetical protein